MKVEENSLAHYGILRKSGRYPWGSGGKWGVDSGKDGLAAVRRSLTFLDALDYLKSQGMTETEIARGWEMTTTELRAARSIARNQKKVADIANAEKLKAKGLSNIAIGEKMGINESSVRSLLAPGAKEKSDMLMSTADMLRRQVDDKGYIQIGVGVESTLGMSSTQLATAAAILKGEGYQIITVQVGQQGSAANKTLVKVLAPPGTTYKDVSTNLDKIRLIDEATDNSGLTFYGIKPPMPISPSRVGVNYKEDGGDLADGMIYVRPGVKDISLDGSTYAQVRVQVGDGHYIKGVAVYKDDLPKGVDLMINTPKSNTGNKFDAMKELTGDKDNPFGAELKRQIGDLNPDGTVKKLTSVMNILNEEGDWGGWSKTISSQVLSKQSPVLVKTQLDMTYERSKNELASIMALTNPSVRQKLLDSYADGADSAAVHLKAAALPRQSWQVILPIKSLRDNEIYAPNYKNGERVAVIRYPHGGKFEIPELTVNNKNAEGKSLLGMAADAVGINAKVAERLSGADFDGDTVLVIPNNDNRVSSEPALTRLKNFNPRELYKPYDGMKTIDGGTWNAATGKKEGVSGKSQKGTQMGLVSNLITDMTIRGATNDEIAQAVRHSMVVIDAEKHNLDYKRSAIEHGIPALNRKYQPREDGGSGGGASTLISRAEGRADVLARKRTFDIDPVTGEKRYRYTGESWPDKKTGETVFRTQRSTKLAEAKDANELSSGTRIERLYATHSNRMKQLANEARLGSLNTKTIPKSETARRVYKPEVDSLGAKLRIAQQNAPRERQAQLLADTTMKLKQQANPNMDDSQLKKARSQALNAARIRTGAKKNRVEITDREWEAIQAGAISKSRLDDILNNSDLERVRELATPRTTILMSSAKTARANAMTAQGYTQAEIAQALGVSLTTLKRGLV